MSDEIASWVDKAAGRKAKLIPLYARAVAEENLQDLLLIRSQMFQAVQEADRLLVSCIARHLERRMRNDG